MDAHERSYIFRFHVFQCHRCLRNGACPMAGFGCNSDTRVHLVAKGIPECGQNVEGQRHKRLTKYLSPDDGPEVGFPSIHAGLEAPRTGHPSKLVVTPFHAPVLVRPANPRTRRTFKAAALLRHQNGNIGDGPTRRKSQANHGNAAGHRCFEFHRAPYARAARESLRQNKRSVSLCCKVNFP
jgi:hypothetical protein